MLEFDFFFFFKYFGALFWDSLKLLGNNLMLLRLFFKVVLDRTRADLVQGRSCKLWIKSGLLPAFVNNGTQTYTFVYVLSMAVFCITSRAE